MQVYDRKLRPPNPLLDEAKVIYDDDHLCVLCKPEGVFTHGYGHARHRKSMTHVITRLVAPSPIPGALKKPGAAHRLDKKTGGLLVFVKTSDAARALQQQWHHERSVTKRCGAAR